MSAGEKHALHAEPAGLAEGVEEAPYVRHAVHAELAGLAEAVEEPLGVDHAVHAEPEPERAKYAEADCQQHAGDACG